MPLILAIEPDRRQASRVAALAQHTHAEILVGHSTQEGIALLSGRAPDLVLTSLLLSPKDEAGLRALDRAGVPVPTLMIPVLASSSRPTQEKGGLLGRMPWMKSGSSESTLEGCDPQLFAAQIVEYLATVSNDKDDLVDIDGMLDAQPAHRTEPARPTETFHESQPVEMPVDQLAGQVEEPAAYVDEPPAHVEEPAAHVERPAAQFVLAVHESLGVEGADDADLMLQVLDFTDAESAEAAEAATQNHGWSDPESDAVDLAADSEWEEILVEDGASVAAAAQVMDHVHVVEAISGDDQDDVPAIELAAETVDLQAFVDELSSTYINLGPLNAMRELMAQQQRAVEVEEARSAQEDAALDPEPPRIAVAHALVTSAMWPPIEGLPADETPVSDLRDIVAEFVAALEGHAEPENTREADTEGELWMPLSAGPGASWPRLDSPAAKARPAQDEWGFFDPDQCGFNALVAKLNELTR